MTDQDDRVHLERMQHDVTCETTEIWCDATGWTGWTHYRNVTADIGRCTCLTCLEEVRDFAKLAHKRWGELVRLDPSLRPDDP